MSERINKIVIVGGGSAGWMTAATLIKVCPNKDITLIESPNVPTVGVGESTLGFIRQWTKLLDIKDTDFLKYTDGTYKLSIRFQDFYKKNSGGFHYPFGGVNIEGNSAAKNDWYFKKFAYPETPISDYADCIYPIMALINENKVTANNELIPNYSFEVDVAYHFDAEKFGRWLKDYYSLPRGVKHVHAHVENIKTNEDGIEYLELDSGEKITADLFIDCTGFRSLLMAGAMQENFISMTNILPNNSAWATQISYKDEEEKIKYMRPYTDCLAQNNGWIWVIPLWSRLGTGYVYSDKYISDEEAKQEYIDWLKKEGLYREDLKFKNIKSRVGVHERLWVKNVAAIGLSAGFIEPLESNGLYSVHEFLMIMVRVLTRDSEEGYVSQWDKDEYNFTCKKLFHQFSKFVALHYALSHRDDTPYWRDVGKRVYEPLMQTLEYKPISDMFLEASTQKMKGFAYDNSGFNAIFTGLNNFPTDQSSLFAHNTETMEYWQERFEQAAKHLDSKKQQWKEAVKEELHMYDFLKKRIYFDE